MVGTGTHLFVAGMDSAHLYLAGMVGCVLVWETFMTACCAEVVLDLLSPSGWTISLAC